MLLNCAAREDSWESLGHQEDQISQSSRKSVLNIHWKDWCLRFNTMATWLMWNTDSLEKTLALWKKSYDKLSILKSRDITLPTKVCLVKAMVFPVLMYGCETWTMKKAEHQRIDAFDLWCWRTAESPLDCREIQPVHPKGNQSWIFIERTDA